MYLYTVGAALKITKSRLHVDPPPQKSTLDNALLLWNIEYLPYNLRCARYNMPPPLTQAGSAKKCENFTTHEADNNDTVV